MSWRASSLPIANVPTATQIPALDRSQRSRCPWTASEPLHVTHASGKTRGGNITLANRKPAFFDESRASCQQPQLSSRKNSSVHHLFSLHMKRLQHLATRTLKNLSSKKSIPSTPPNFKLNITEDTTSRMAATDMGTSSPVPSKPTTPLPLDQPGVLPPRADILDRTGYSTPMIQQVRFPVKDGHGGSAHGFLHLPSDAASKPLSKTAAILLSGAGGGVIGPSGLYLSLGTKLPALSARMPTLRLDYRYAARTAPCVADTKAAMDHMQEHYGIENFILVGWSFGGAPVFTLAGRDERIIGAATVASQTADALKGAREAGRRGIPILLCHGTGDRTLRPQCSEYLHESWFEGYKGPEKGEEKARLVMFEGDDHALTRNAKKVEEIMARFIVDTAGERLQNGDRKVTEADVLVGKDERVGIMRRGGDLRGKESVE